MPMGRRYTKNERDLILTPELLSSCRLCVAIITWDGPTCLVCLAWRDATLILYGLLLDGFVTRKNIYSSWNKNCCADCQMLVPMNKGIVTELRNSTASVTMIMISHLL